MLRLMGPLMLPSTPRPDLDAIEARANAATPGPWGVSDIPGYYTVGEGPEAYHIRKERDDDFISRARQDVPALVAYARSLEDNLERVKQAFYGWADQSDENRKSLAAEYLIGIGKIVVPPEVRAEAP